MTKLFQKLWLSCQKAVELMHKKHNVGLSTSEKCLLKVHTGICSACKTFEKQVDFIERNINEMNLSKTDYPTDDLKSKTIAALTNNPKN
ncbi:MAG: hypothetical protein H6607_00905 [Flavobacteriales bacterium]|nr:hypothetical protein [Flavobacteriales bacterium]